MALAFDANHHTVGSPDAVHAAWDRFDRLCVAVRVGLDALAGQLETASGVQRVEGFADCARREDRSFAGGRSGPDPPIDGTATTDSVVGENARPRNSRRTVAADRRGPLQASDLIPLLDELERLMAEMRTVLEEEADGGD